MVKKGNRKLNELTQIIFGENTVIAPRIGQMKRI
jgi:hypothetical protein